MHHTKDKGDLGNIKIMSDLSSQGFKILTPLSEHLPFDFVAYDPLTNKLLRVQSKFKSLSNGILSVDLRTCYSSSKDVFIKRYEDDSFDVLATYCNDLGKVVYILETELRTLVRSVNFCLLDRPGKRFVDDYINLRNLLDK